MVTLKELRLNQGLTQAQLAEKVNVCRVSITEWEIGKSEPRSLKTVEALAKALNCSIDTLVKALK